MTKIRLELYYVMIISINVILRMMYSKIAQDICAIHLHF